MASKTVLLNRLLLMLSVGGISAGLLASAAGMSSTAALFWALTTGLTLPPLVYSIVRALRHGDFGVDVIALLAMLGALALQEYIAGAVIAVMLAGGRALEDWAEGRARRELSALIRRSPRSVHRETAEGALVDAPIEDVRPGDLLLVKPGEIVPVDGTVVEGTAVLDESALTGEAKPVERTRAERVRSGTANAARTPFRLRAAATAEGSTYAGIIRLVREAEASKAPLVRLADRYAIFFLPVALGLAGVAGILSGDPVRALAVLVVATPCPLILAAPIAIVAGISRAARRGIIVKGGGPFETLARAETLFLDKTGTVTSGAPTVTEVVTFTDIHSDELIRLAASLDQVSPHVFATPVLEAASQRGVGLSYPAEVIEELGSGIRGIVDGRKVAVGKADWILDGKPGPESLRRLRERLRIDGAAGVFVQVDGEPAGALVLEDPLRPDARITLRALRRSGFRRITLLSGDHAGVADPVGAVLGVDAVLSERSPSEKVDAVRSSEGVSVMVGDGVNDAPALAAADVGVAMGARGATASSDAADVVLLVDRLDRLNEAVEIARRSRSIALQSIGVGMGLSVVAMGAAAAGLLAPVAGALVQEGIDVLVILNALRALRGGRGQNGEHPVAHLIERFRAEHDRLLPGIRRIRSVADHLDLVPPEKAASELHSLRDFLVNDVLPHERAEGAEVFPEMAQMTGRDDSASLMSQFSLMSQGHAEIERLTDLFDRHLRGVPGGGPSTENIRELRQVLYGLDSTLRLHTAQEEKSFLALVEEHAGPGCPATTSFLTGDVPSSILLADQ